MFSEKKNCVYDQSGFLQAKVVIVNWRKMAKNIFVLVCSICMFPGTTCAASDGSHNLLTLFTAAISYDAEYQKAIFERLAVVEEVNQANARMYPTVGLSAEKRFLDQDISREEESLLINSGRERYTIENYSVSVVQPLYRYDTLAGILQAEARSDSSDMTLALARQALLLRLIERYLNVLAAQDALEFSRKEEEAVANQYKLAEARLKAQLGTKTDLLDAQARYAVVRAATIAAENVLLDALQGLTEVTGLNVRKLVPLGEIPMLIPNPNDVSQWVNAALRYNIAIKQRKSVVDVAREEIRKQRSVHHPTLDFVVRRTFEETGRDNFGQDSTTNSIEAALQFNLSLYQGGTVNSRVRQAYRLMRASRADLDKERRSVAREVRASFLGVKTALQRIDSLNQAVEAQELVVKTRRAGYPRIYTSLDVLDAEKELYSAKRDLARSKYDYLFNEARLRAVIGALNDADLVEISQWFTGKLSLPSNEALQQINEAQMKSSNYEQLIKEGVVDVQAPMTDEIETENVPEVQ